MDSKHILDREFLEMRAKILQLAASLDRIERAEGDVTKDESMELVQKGLAILLSADPNRAEQVQLLFSNEYDQGWRENFQITPRA